MIVNNKLRNIIRTVILGRTIKIIIIVRYPILLYSEVLYFKFLPFDFAKHLLFKYDKSSKVCRISNLNTFDIFMER